MKPPRELRERFYHAPDTTPWLGDSETGLKYAKYVGHFEWADINCLVTADCVMVATHSRRPLLHGWHDPLRRIPRRAPIERMTWAEVKRLRTRNGYRIVPVGHLLHVAAKLGIGVELELKDGPFTQTNMDYLATIVYALQIEHAFKVKTLSNLRTKRAARQRLTYAHRAGLTTVLLPRGRRRLPASQWWPITDYVRGHITWT